MKWDEDINSFIFLAEKKKVKMIMVGGGAVNFHGYQRHSADVDFWIDNSEDNLKKLLHVFVEMGYKIDSFPKEVIDGKQNISIKFSPNDLNLELITNFAINKTFDEALKDSEPVTMQGKKVYKWRVLNFDDLILSKIKSNRTKDLLDIQELTRIRNMNK